MKYLKKFLLSLAVFMALSVPAYAVISTAYPYTLTNGTTADASQVMANFNNIQNNVNSNAAHNGVNSDITALTGLSTPLNQGQGGTPLYIGVTPTNTLNAYSLATTVPSNFTLTTGLAVSMTVPATNTGASTLTIGALASTPIDKYNAAGTVVALAAGDLVNTTTAIVSYDGTEFILLNPITQITTNATLYTSSGIFSDRYTTEQTIASATTTDLGTSSNGSNIMAISGTTTITSFGSSASAASPLYFLRFTGILTLTYNASSMILPGAANITTAAGDTMVAQYLGSGNWKVSTFTRAATGGALHPNLVKITATQTYTPSAGLQYAYIRICGAGGGGGTFTSVNAIGGGGGGGEGVWALLTASTIGASQTVTIGTAGTVGSQAGGAGGTGGTTSFGAIATAVGGTGGPEALGTTTGVQGGAGGTGGTIPAGGLDVPGARGGSSAATGTPVQYGTASGGAGPFGFGAGGNGFLSVSTPVQATAATGFCSGGGGGANGATNVATAGAGGLVMIEEWIQ